MIEAEVAAGRRYVQLGFMRRFDESYTQMKAALDAGALGRALMMHNFHRNVETPAADFTGAMAISNSAPHEFDVARFVLGTEFVAISAFQPRRSDARVAPVLMVLEFADGQLVSIEINNNAAYGYDVRGELVGEKGSVWLNRRSMRASISTSGRTSTTPATGARASRRLIAGRTPPSCASPRPATFPPSPRTRSTAMRRR